MRWSNVASAGVALVVMALGAVAFAACASSADTDPTPVTKFKITPAPPGYTPPAASGASAATPPASASPAATSPAASTPAASPSVVATEPASGGDGSVLELVASNIVFDKTELTAKAGKVTIKLDNRDGGVPHNIQVFKGSSASGVSVGMTDLETGPVKQTLELDLQPGEYFYQCDVHPTTMTGTLTVT